MEAHVTPYEVYNSIVCEAIGCYSKADTEVRIKVANKRVLLCFLAKSVD
jgi:hypothetical protein